MRLPLKRRCHCPRRLRPAASRSPAESAEPPPFFSRFDALREVVLPDDDDRARARDRARFYKSRGFEVTHMDLKANG
jgi:hypothetical protein